MGDIAVKIKGNRVTCQIGKPKFQCKVQGVVIQGVRLLDYPICDNQTDARENFNLDTDAIFWYSLDTDEGVPYTLARVRPIVT